MGPAADRASPGILASRSTERAKDSRSAGVLAVDHRPEAARQADYVMFYTYYAARACRPISMRNWKYWHDHLIPDNLWLIFGYFREYYTCHTRLMLANLPDGVNLAFWRASGRQWMPSTREDPPPMLATRRIHTCADRASACSTRWPAGAFREEKTATRGESGTCTGPYSAVAGS